LAGIRFRELHFRTNADDRLSRSSLSRIEGGDSIVESGDGTNVCAQTAVPHPLDNLAQLRVISFD